MTRLFAVAGLALGMTVSAQTGISSQCMTGLAQIATNSTSACLSPSSLLSFATVSANTSVIDPINTWLSNVCSIPACSNSTIAAVVTNLTTACSAELSAFGFTSNDTATLISTVQEAYPTVRDVACLKDGSTNCVTETLTNVQSVIGTLSLTNLEALMVSTNISLPSNVTCTNCTKAAYNTINTGFPGLLDSENSTLQSKCGSSFTDGSTPSGITESADNSTTSSGSNNSAPELISKNTLLGVIASVFLVIGSAFAML